MPTPNFDKLKKHFDKSNFESLGFLHYAPYSTVSKVRRLHIDGKQAPENLMSEGRTTCSRDALTGLWTVGWQTIGDPFAAIVMSNTVRTVDEFRQVSVVENRPNHLCLDSDPVATIFAPNAAGLLADHIVGSLVKIYKSPEWPEHFVIS